MDAILSDYLERIAPFPARVVSVIGLGPGDPGLITVRAAVRMRQADVVFFDFGDRPSAIWDLLSPGVERTLISSELPTAEIVRMIRPHVEADCRVAYLTNGDPLVFERAEFVAEALADMGVAIEIVPGLTAGLTGAAYAGISLTGYGSGVLCFAAGESHSGSRIPTPELATILCKGTLVLYVAEEHMQRLCQELRDCGTSGRTPVTVVENATAHNQHVIRGTLDMFCTPAERRIVGSPSLVYIGSHALPRVRLNWFKPPASDDREFR